MITLFSCLTCFGGGVILTSCLTHMLPDVNEVWGFSYQISHLRDKVKFDTEMSHMSNVTYVTNSK